MDQVSDGEVGPAWRPDVGSLSSDRCRRPGAKRRAAGWAVLLGLLPAGCAERGPEHLHCDDLMAPEQVDFNDLVQLSLNDPDKGCVEGSCHNADVQRGHLRLDTPELLFEEYSLHPELNYALLVTGRMPDHGDLWTEEELRLFRSWYCYGAFPP